MNKVEELMPSDNPDIGLVFTLGYSPYEGL